MIGKVVLISVITMLNLSDDLISKYFELDHSCLREMKIGKFESVGLENRNQVLRGEKEQVELFNNGSSMVVSKIKWLDSRCFELKVKKTINCPNLKYVKRGTKILVTITSCDSLGYICQIIYDNKKKLAVRYDRIK